MTSLLRSAAESISYPDGAAKSAALYQRASRVLPSGNSRTTIFFKPHPIYADRAAGCRVTDVDGVERIDFLNNYTSLIHGHCHPDVMDAVRAQLEKITTVAMPTESEIALAELLVERLAGVEQVRFLNSGTEAVMMSIKAARAYTGRTKIAKVEGTYHGAYDFAEVSLAPDESNWGPAERPASVPAYVGQPSSVLDEVVVLPWNNVEATRRILESEGPQLAGILFDVLPSRLGFVPIQKEYLALLTEQARKHGALLILDEVFSLRLGFSGGQGRLGITPDITAMGKIIGGGFPVGAVGGRAEVMSVFGFEKGRPRLPHGGTFNANPITMAAGLRAMQLWTPAEVTRIGRLGLRLRDGLRTCLTEANIAGQVTGEESFAMLFLSERPIRDFRDVAYSWRYAARHEKLHRFLLNHGVLTSPALLFSMSTAMTEHDIDFTVEQVRAGLRE
jgi:glutamate-1-semialdehyde 2,1-aminomutase